MSTQIYDEFTLALHALRGLDSLVSGAGNIILPNELGPLLSMITDKFDSIHAQMKENQ
jgi:hypothetical protein